MWVLVDNKIKSYQIYGEIALLFIFLHQPLILQLLQPHTNRHHNDGGIRSDGGLFDGMRLVIIAIAIDLTFICLIDP